jgi:hypothetical protein
MTVELPAEAKVVNVGLSWFADSVRAQGGDVEHVDWRIPADGDPVAVAALTRLYGRAGSRIERANAEVLHRLDRGLALLHDVRQVIDVVPGVTDRTLLHCGPAIDWPDVCDPLRRSMRAAVVAEGWALDVEQADRLLAGGEITLAPANLHDTVVPMASAIGPSAPVYVVGNADGPTTAFAPISQGPGEVAWFGRETPAAIDRLRFLRDVAGPALREVIRAAAPIDVFGLATQGLHMGDDLHMRTQATTNLLIRTLLPQLVDVGGREGRELGRFLAGNHLFFLTIAMAAAKSLTLWAEQVPDSSIVTTMARNGTTFGIRLAGSQHWSIADAPPVQDALYHAGQGPQTSAKDIGDSAVLELVGLGGPAAAGSPAVAAFLGGTMADARRATEQMVAICAAQSSRFTLPALDGRGTPVGVDVRKVVELGLTPRINTGILHARDGSGQVGAGVATAPLASFVDALLDLDRRLGADASLANSLRRRARPG